MKHFNLCSLLLALTAITLVATGCNKEDDNVGNGGSGNSNLTAIEQKIVGKWQPISEFKVVVFSSGNDTQITLEPCETDDVYTFTDKKEYTVSDGSNACSTIGATYTGTFPWSVTVDSTFNFTHGPGRYTPKIRYIDNSTLRLYSYDGTATSYATYTRK